MERFVLGAVAFLGGATACVAVSSGVTASRLTPSAVTASGVTAPAVTASGGAAPAVMTTVTPRSERDVPNVDVLRQQIRNYYGDPWGTGVAASDGNYAREVASVIADVRAWLLEPSETTTTGAGGASVVFDVDDTLLLNYGYTIYSNWAFNLASFTTFVTEQWFPAVPGMVDLVAFARQQGYAIFFITGRHADVEQATLGNLTADGVGFDAGFGPPTAPGDGEDGLFTLPAVEAYPGYLKAACAANPDGTCGTVDYKSATRAHLESLGYRIVANVGDQLSDLEGGHADRTFKLPNPNYVVS